MSGSRMPAGGGILCDDGRPRKLHAATKRGEAQRSANARVTVVTRMPHGLFAMPRCLHRVRPLQPWLRRNACYAAIVLTTLPTRRTDAQDIVSRQRDTGAVESMADASRAGLVVGSELERYLRALELTTHVAPGTWTIRPLSALADSALLAWPHPWQQHLRTAPTLRARSLELLPPSARLVYNSTFAAPMNDGPAWQGRGVTGELAGGVRARWKALQLELAPVLFLAQNAPFPLALNGSAGKGALRDARFPDLIDAPQRFGTSAYGRLDGGASSVAVTLPFFTAGLTTAAEAWGPAREFPLILGGTGGGFPHAFVATRTPVPLWLFTLQTRVILGTLSQSSLSPVDTGPAKRWASAVAIAIVPRGVPGLTIGATRFVEAALSSRFPSLNLVGRPFSGIAVNNRQNVGSENQLASAFFRWAFPGAGAEVYGEYGKDDYSLDIRRFLQYPDDLRSYMFGIQHAARPSPDALRVVRFELVNAEVSSSNRGERGDPVDKTITQPYPPYLHYVVRQGHTNNGRFLGSAEAYGGAAVRAGIDRYAPRGRTSFTFERSLRFDWLPTTPVPASGVHPDVLWTVGAEQVRFVGGRDYTFSLAGMADMNRNLVDGHTAFNVRASVAIRGWR